MLNLAWQLLSFNGAAHYMAKKANHIVGGRLESEAQLEKVIAAANDRSYDLFLQLNPCLPCGIKASREHITHWRYVLVDLDPAHEPRSLEQPTVPDRLRPAHVVRTGRGFHWWLPVAHHEPLHQAAAPRVERSVSSFLRGLQAPHRWRIDSCTSDLPRLVRCPGSINQKSGVRAAVLVVAAGSHPPETFLACDPGEPAPITNCVNPGQWFAHLTFRARDFLQRGVETPGRRTAAWHATKALHEVGVDIATAERLLRVAGTMCRPPIDPADITRRINQVYGK